MTSTSLTCSRPRGPAAGAFPRPREEGPRPGSPTPPWPTPAEAPPSSSSSEECKAVGWMTSGSWTSVGPNPLWVSTNGIFEWGGSQFGERSSNPLFVLPVLLIHPICSPLRFYGVVGAVNEGPPSASQEPSLGQHHRKQVRDAFWLA